MGVVIFLIGFHIFFFFLFFLSCLWIEGVLTSLGKNEG